MKPQSIERFARTCKRLDKAAERDCGMAYLDSDDQGWRFDAPRNMVWKATNATTMLVSFDATDIEIDTAIGQLQEGVIDEVSE